MRRSLLLLGASLFLGGCIVVKIDPTKPIEVHVKVEVTVDKALDDFFGDLDKKDPTMNPGAK